jgi:hypothetical protein
MVKFSRHPNFILRDGGSAVAYRFQSWLIAHPGLNTIYLGQLRSDAEEHGHMPSDIIVLDGSVSFESEADVNGVEAVVRTPKQGKLADRGAGGKVRQTRSTLPRCQTS